MINLIEKSKEFCKDIFTLETLPKRKQRSNNCFPLKGDQPLSENELFIQEIEKAKEEWIIAQSNFEQVYDQDLVEQAVLAIAAAERKYIFLLKEAQKKKLNSEYVYTSFGTQL